MYKRILSLVLSLLMLVSAVPIQAFATQIAEPEACQHSWDAGVVTAPNCESAGYTTYTCTLCAATENRDATEALGHSWGEGVPVAPGCVTVGCTLYTCAVCGSTRQEDEVPALTHSWDEGVVTAAQCEAEGYTTFTCGICGATEKRDTTEALIHIWGEGIATAPTCEAGGGTTYTCTLCGATRVENETAPLGHSWGQWNVVLEPTALAEGKQTRVCDLCSAAEEAPVEKLPAVAAASVTVSQAQGYTEVLLTDELQLTAVVLPEDTTDKTILWTSSDETIATVDETGLVTGIALGEVTITAACGEASGTYALEVVMPEMATLEEAPYSGNCGDHTGWTFDESTGLLKIIGYGAIKEDYSGTVMPWYPHRDKITCIYVDEGITEIPKYAFEYLRKVEKISLPETLTTLSLQAFNDCASLQNLMIPASVQSITSAGSYEGNMAFNRCNALTDVYYKGTAKEWSTFPYSDHVVNNIVNAGTRNITMHFLVLHENPSTCTEPGTQSYYTFDDTTIYSQMYDLEKHVITALDEIPVADHKWIAHNICEDCGVVEVTCGENLTWSFDRTIGKLTISGSGDMHDYSYAEPAPWQAFAEEIKIIEIQEGVAGIGSAAFSACSSLEQLHIPSTLTRVGDSAFYKEYPGACKGFWSYINQTVHQWSVVPVGENNEYFPHWNSVQFVNKDYAQASGKAGEAIYWELLSSGKMLFFGDGDMYSFGETASPYWSYPARSVDFSGSITSIGASAFEVLPDEVMARNFASITIPGTIERIEDRAFAGCGTLDTIVFTGNAPAFADDCFLNVEATAYYPAGNDTWTQEVQQSYGGNITWCPDYHTHDFSNNNQCKCGFFGGVCGENAAWLLDPECGRLVITGSGKMDDYTGSYAPWYANRAMITSIEIEDGITAIGADAFCHCSAVTSLRVPGSVKEIGKKAFANCSALQKLHIPASVTTIAGTAATESPFYGCAAGLEIYCEADRKPDGWGMYWNSGRKAIFRYAEADYHYWLSPLDKTGHIDIPEGITIIPAGTFADCTGLTGITLPFSLTRIENNAFRGCTGLTNVSIPGGVRAIGSGAFAGCTGLTSVDIPASVRTIGKDAFAGCNALAAVNFDGTVKQWLEIAVADGNEAVESVIRAQQMADDSGYCGENLLWTFDQKTGKLTITGTGDMADWAEGEAPWCNYSKQITEVVLGSGVTGIGSYAFSFCYNLKELTIPESVTRLGKDCVGETGITELVIPASVNAFGGGIASNLEKITVHPDNQTFSNDEYGILYNKDKTELLYCPTSAQVWELYIAETTQRISAYAFAGCGNMEVVYLPASVAEIGNNAFAACWNLGWLFFDGDAPSFGQDSLAGIRAVIRYSSATSGWEDVSWDSAAQQKKQYGGTITWQPDGLRASGVMKQSIWWELDMDGVLSIYGNGYMDGMDDVEGPTVRPWKEYTDYIEKVILAEGIGNIPNGAFADCHNLAQIQIPSTVTYIGFNSMRNCYALKEVRLPNAVTTIGFGAFWDSGLERIQLSAGLQTINDCAFHGCSYLEDITIPSRVTYVGQGAFRDSGLKTIRFTGNPPTFGNHVLTNVTADALVPRKLLSAWEKAVGNMYYEGDVTWYTYGTVASGTLKPGITWELDDSGVLTISGTGWMDGMLDYNNTPQPPWKQYRNYIYKVVLGEGICNIPNGAFQDCYYLEEIVLPSTLQYVGVRSLAWCWELDSIVFPASVNEIASDAFFRAHINTITFEGDMPYFWNEPKRGWEALADLSGATIYYPALAYGWSSCELHDNPNAYGGSGNFLVAYGDPEQQIREKLNKGYCWVDRDITLTRDLVIPEDTFLAFVEGATLTVPSGVRLVINGQLYLGDGDYTEGNMVVHEGGALSFGTRGWLNVYEGTLTMPQVSSASLPDGRISVYDGAVINNVPKSKLFADWYVSTMPDLLRLLKESEGYGQAAISCRNMNITGDIEIPANVMLLVLSDWDANGNRKANKVTINPNVTVVNRGVIDIGELGNLIVSANSVIECTEDGWVYVAGGTLTNNGKIYTAPGNLVKDDGSKIIGTGKHIEQAFLSNLDSFWPILDSIQAGADYVEISDSTLVIDGDIELPAGVNLVFKGCDVTIVKNVTVRSNTANALTFLESGSGKSVLNLLGDFEGKEIICDESCIITPEAKVAKVRIVDNLRYVTLGKIKATGVILTGQPDGEPINGKTITVDMKNGEAVHLFAHTEPEGASDVFTWKSSSAAIASVDSFGTLTLKKPGTVTITATTKDGSNKSASVKVTVSYVDSASRLTIKSDIPAMGLQHTLKGHLAVYGSDGVTPIDPEHLTFSIPEKQQHIATVDENGVVTAGRTNGTATVTAAITGDPLNRKVTLNVKVVAPQTEDILLLPSAASPASIVMLDKTGAQTESPEEAVKYELYLDKDDVPNGYTFVISPKVWNTIGEIATPGKGSLRWNTTDNRVATMKENADGSATVTIKAKTDGACAITATSTDLVKLESSLTIHVRDYTPRLESDSLSLNCNLTTGSSIRMMASYGRQIQAPEGENPISLHEYDSKTRTYLEVPSDRFEAAYTDGILTIRHKAFVANTSAKLLLKVKCLVNAETGTYKTYEQPITVKVNNTLPAVTIKQPVRFNLHTGSEVQLQITAKDTFVTDAKVDTATSTTFENLTGEDAFHPETGTLSLRLTDAYRTNGVLDDKVDILVYMEGYAEPYRKSVTIGTTTNRPAITVKQSDKVNLFYTDSLANLAVTVKDEVVTGVRLDPTSTASFREYCYDDQTQTLTLALTEEYLNKTVRMDASVNLLVYLAGYNCPIVKTFTVGTATVKPTLVLSSASSVINTALNLPLEAMRTTFQILNKTTGSYTTAVTGISADVRNGTPFAAGSVANDEVSLTLTYKDGNKGGTATITVREPNWTDAIKLTHRVTVQTTLPTTKMGAATLKLNRVFSGRSAETTLALSQDNLHIESVEFIPNGRTPEIRAEAEKIQLVYDRDTGRITAMFDPNCEELPKNGTYQFQYIVTLTEGNTQLTEKKTINVSVDSAIPTVRLKSSSFRLNTVLWFYGETAQSQITMTGGQNCANPRFVVADGHPEIVISCETDAQGNSVLTARLENKTVPTGKYTVKLNPVVRDTITGTDVVLPSTVTLTVQVHETLPTPKLGNSMLKLNRIFTQQTASTTLVLNPDAAQVGAIASYASTARAGTAQWNDAQKIALTYSESTGSIIASIRQEYWTAPPANGNYTFDCIFAMTDGTQLKPQKITVNVHSTLPGVRLKTGTLALNKVYFHLGATAETEVILTNGTGYSVAGFLEMSGNKLISDVVELSYHDGKLTARLTDPSAANKRHSFKLTPILRHENGQEAPMTSQVTVTVSIENKMPTVKFATPTLRLNRRLAGNEIVTSGITLSGANGYKLVGFRELIGWNHPDVKLTFANGELRATGRNAQADLRQKHTFQLTPIVEDAEGRIGALQGTASISVQYYDAAPSATASSKGKLDTTDLTSSLTYTISLKNTSGTVAKAVLEGTDSSRFGVSLGRDKGKDVVHITLKGNERYQTNKTYKMQLVLTVCRMQIPVSISFKVNQSGLKFAAIPVQKLYQFQKEPVTFQVALASPANAQLYSIKLNESKTTAAFVKAMDGGRLQVEFAEDCRSAQVKLAVNDPGYLAYGKSYTVVLDVTPKNNASNLTPTQVTLTVKTYK